MWVQKLFAWNGPNPAPTKNPDRVAICTLNTDKTRRGREYHIVLLFPRVELKQLQFLQRRPHSSGLLCTTRGEIHSLQVPSGALDPTQEPRKRAEQPGPAHAPHFFPSPALPWAAGCSTVLPSKFPVPCGSRNAPGKLPVLWPARWVTLYDAHRPVFLLSSLQFCACRVVPLITFLLPSQQWKVSAAELPHAHFSLTASYISPPYPLLRAYSPTKRIVVNDLGSWVRF